MDVCSLGTFFLLFLLLFGLLLFNCSRSALIFSSKNDAGSSLGSWGTSSPRKALIKMVSFFYPVTNERYVQEIATKWNVRDSGVGYVTRFNVKKEFMDKYKVHQVGASYHTECWIPCEELEQLNQNIVGKIEVIGEYKAEFSSN